MEELIPNLRDERVQGAVKNLLAYSLVILIVPLSSMFLLKQYFFEAFLGHTPNDSLTYSAVCAVVLVHVQDPHDEPVHLGFPVSLPPNELFRLRSQFLPLGKVGGKPSWLNPKALPHSNTLICKVCEKPMCFLIQVYASGPNEPEHSFHRSLFVFVCRNPKCSKPNDASNMAVFRCSLPRKNEFYSFDGPMDPDLDGDVPDPRLPPDGPKLCSLCGCSATKKCAKCQNTWYCSRDHQVVDWASHKTCCGVFPDESAEQPEPSNPANPFVFKEFGIELDQEYLNSDMFEELSDDEDDEDEDCVDDETDEDRKRRMDEFKKFAKQNESNANMTKEDLEAATEEQKRDGEFEKFNRLVSLNPEQIIRYKRFGEPLPATCQSPLPDPESVPPCENCSGPRRFEMQLMPHLLSIIEVDAIGQSIDWASVFIYTCSQSCEVPESGYAKEFLAKQDFS
ncbi:unnamed protein product [Caenorhabditis auriculariae]|uniref:MYND-type domain-containing protein n=1 Tax=Caenorhabditis auriculariae TaxID=2777116 RepID=A0A8S1GQY7_9PELO|nr:unnamed protein product [Caenorhabditis auriculariae]